MTTDHEDYRTVLKAALLQNGNKAGVRSIRALAEKLGVSNSFLSEVLNGHKTISVELAFKMAVKLGLTANETQRFCLVVQLENEKDAEFKAELIERLNSAYPNDQRHDVSADIFKSISEWYHFAILELTNITGFLTTPESVATRLGISKAEASLAIERLERLSLLRKHPQRGYEKTHEIVSGNSAVPVEAFRKFHTEVLIRAEKALLEQSPSERVSSSEFIPLDPKHIAVVDRLSREFSAAVLTLSEKAKTKAHVYALSVHCFRLSKKAELK